MGLYGQYNGRKEELCKHNTVLLVTSGEWQVAPWQNHNDVHLWLILHKHREKIITMLVVCLYDRVVRYYKIYMARYICMNKSFKTIRRYDPTYKHLNPLRWKKPALRTCPAWDLKFNCRSKITPRLRTWFQRGLNHNIIWDNPGSKINIITGNWEELGFSCIQF